MSSQDSGTGRGARDGAAGVTVSSSPTSAVNWPDECRPVAASQLMSSVFVSKREVFKTKIICDCEGKQRGP